MTPLIDVMLVLLVIFMITAPLMTLEPEARPAEDRCRPAERHAAVHRRGARPQGRIYFGDEARRRRPRSPRASPKRRASNPQTEVQLRADQSVPYGRVAELIGIVQKAGLTRIGFVTEPAGVDQALSAGALSRPAQSTPLGAGDTSATKRLDPDVAARQRDADALAPRTARGAASAPPARRRRTARARASGARTRSASPRPRPDPATVEHIVDQRPDHLERLQADGLRLLAVADRARHVDR